MSEDQKNDLLDMFAAHAMNALASRAGRPHNTYLAQTAYRIALAMVNRKEELVAEAIAEAEQEKLNKEQRARMAAKFPSYGIKVDN